jgi:hypothetical protein
VPLEQPFDGHMTPGAELEKLGPGVAKPEQPFDGHMTPGPELEKLGPKYTAPFGPVSNVVCVSAAH